MGQPAHLQACALNGPCGIAVLMIEEWTTSCENDRSACLARSRIADATEGGKRID
jgi:hypothetical protein